MTLTVETWCEALESGRYEQSKGRLKSGDAYCCLGLACELSGIGRWNDEDGYQCKRCGIWFSTNQVLPAEVRQRIGLGSLNGSFVFGTLPPELQEEIRRYWKHTDRDPETLAALNDAGVPFSIIAKVIRARPEGLFREAA